MSGRWNQRGVSLVELVSVSAVLLVLASITLPVASTMVKRQRELELRQALREIRAAIDKFQVDVGSKTKKGRYATIRDTTLDGTNDEGYPEKLEWLVEGVDVGLATPTTFKYLRRIPMDPFTREREWGTRSSRDGPDALFTDGINIFDVYSLSDKTALDGTKYSEW